MGDPARKKRKAIHDYFLPSTKRVAAHDEPSSEILCQVREHKSQDILASMTAVPGLTLHSSFVTAREEQQILDFLNNAAKCTWRTDLSRRTIHFGGTYCLMPPKSTPIDKTAQPEILQAPDLPEELSWLIERLVDADIFQADKVPQYCIVNEYTGNLGISAHAENFQFGEPVVGLSLLSACPIRFHELEKPFDGSVRSGKAARAEKTGKRIDVQLPGRSLLVMRGESRWKWQHEIVRSAKGRGVGWKRVSLTFRWKLPS